MLQSLNKSLGTDQDAHPHGEAVDGMVKPHAC